MFPWVALAAALLFGPHTVSGNFPRDLCGPVDNRMAGQSCGSGSCVWGTAEAQTLPITFHSPAGYRVRLLRLRGDLVAWIKTLPGDPAPALRSAAGVLLGFSTSADGGSSSCDYCADNTPLYIQDAVMDSMPKTRAPFDYADVGFTLPADNVLLLKIASWLNSTGDAIHVEATYTIQFDYVPGEDIQ